MGDYGQYIVPEPDELINFKVGQPPPCLLPLDKIRESAQLKFQETDPMFLQYGHVYGYPKFRQSLAKFLTHGYHHQVDPEKLMITNGVTGGLSLIASLFLQAGDLVFMEEPTYFLALSIMKDFKLTVRQIPMEQDGIDVHALEQLLQRGVIPKVLYIIPTCHNPTGRTLSHEKRQKIVQLSIQYNFVVLADEVYQLLSFPHVTPPPPMFTFDTHGTVLALGSFSKILAPALRLGWIQGSKPLLKRIADSGQLDSSGGINPVISGIVHAAIDSGKQQEHLDFAVQTLWSRADALMKELKQRLPEGVTFEVPDGGYFVLVRLPDHLNAAELLPIAEKHKVVYLPGSSFSQNMKNFLRLSFSWYDEPALQLGARRLADAIKEYQQQVDAQAHHPKALCAAKSSDQVIQVAVHGHQGRLGSLIVNQLQCGQDAGIAYAGAFDVRNKVFPPQKFDVLIDVTLPIGTENLIQHLQAQHINVPLVVGTTGSLPMACLESYAKQNAVVIKSNFSFGVPLVSELIKHAANRLPSEEDWSVDVMEIHHTKKMDAPSGTAKTLAKELESTGAKCVEKSLNAQGHLAPKAMRLGDEFGQHTVYFAGPGERIEIKHQATRREVFAIGAVRTAKEAVRLAAGLHQ